MMCFDTVVIEHRVLVKHKLNYSHLMAKTIKHGMPTDDTIPMQAF